MFVLTEAHLNDYLEDYFPSELFNYSKSLFKNQGLRLWIQSTRDKKKFKQSFNSLCDSSHAQLRRPNLPKNMYQLKGLFSQFMLLPAVYCQARDGKGIYKKFSFDTAKVDFSSRDWSIMDEVSSLRENWSYNISSLRRRMFSWHPQFSRCLARSFAPLFLIVFRGCLTYIFIREWSTSSR